MRKTLLAIAAAHAYAGVFILADQPPAHAETAKCDPIFVTVDAELTHATIACNKDYMDTKIGIYVTELAHECFPVLGKHKYHDIIITAMRNWEITAAEYGKKEACAMTERAFNAIEAASAPPH